MPPTGSVQDLALELLQEIILLACQKWDDSLSKKELSLLRLVSWKFRDAVDPFLFAELKFDFVKLPFEIVIQQLRDMAERKTEICLYVKKLIIESTEVQLPGSFTQGTYANLLTCAVKSLLELRSLRWDFSYCIEQELREPLHRWTLCAIDGFYSVSVDSIMNLVHVTEVYIDFSRFPVLWQLPDMIMLHRFTQLQSLGFRASNPSSPLADSFIQQLRINSTKKFLTSLDIEFTTIPRNKEIFYEIVKDIPQQTPLKLKHLRVHGWKLVLNPTTVPHLRCLSSLDLSYGHDTLMDQQSHASVWSNLINTGIHLKRISSVICRPLNLYLSSYTALEHLTITLPRNDDMRVNSVTSEPLFGDLCQNSLSTHNNTLKIFKVIERSNSGHCLLSDISAIRNCEKLEYLAITVKKDHMDSFGDIVSTALGMPRLQVLDIGGYNPVSRHHMHRIMNKIEPKILDVLKNLGKRSGPGSTATIVLGDKRYETKQGGSWESHLQKNR